MAEGGGSRLVHVAASLARFGSCGNRGEGVPLQGLQNLEGRGTYEADIFIEL